MALKDMEEIGHIDPTPGVGSKVVAYFSPTDKWNSAGDTAEVGKALPGARIEICKEGHVHGFVLHTQSALRIAEMTWGWVEKDVPIM